MEFIDILNDGDLIQIKPDLTRQFAFIDESGNFGFDFESEGVSTHFVVTAILVDQNNISQLEESVELIRKKHFQTGEMKSSSVSDNDIRRIKILTELKDLPFHIFSVVVDKRKIYKDSGGLIYKKVFIKFLNNLIHKELYRAFPNLQMIADEHGRKEFMEEFKRYVSKKHMPNLFETYEFGFAKSKSNILIQLSDLICGTIATGFDEKQKSEKFSNFLSILKSKMLVLKEWPESYENYLVQSEIDGQTKFNEIIARQAIRLAKDFLEQNENTKIPEVEDQLIFLRFLLFNLRFLKSDGYVPTHEITKNLSMIRKKKYNNHYLMTQVVARLRDQGVIIASSSQGYKLPVSEKELYDFVNRSSTVIMPMLNRLKRCREQIKVATKNELDILDKPEYQELKRYFDS